MRRGAEGKLGLASTYSLGAECTVDPVRRVTSVRQSASVSIAHSPAVYHRQCRRGSVPLRLRACCVAGCCRPPRHFYLGVVSILGANNFIEFTL